MAPGNKITKYIYYSLKMAKSQRFYQLLLIQTAVKMWPGGTPHVVVGTLKISLDRLKKTTKKKNKKKECERLKTPKTDCTCAEWDLTRKTLH